MKQNKTKQFSITDSPYRFDSNNQIDISHCKKKHVKAAKNFKNLIFVFGSSQSNNCRLRDDEKIISCISKHKE